MKINNKENICNPTQIPRSGFLLLIANSFKVSTRPLILFKASTQLLNEPCPGKTTLSEDLILFISGVTTIFTLSIATALKEFITELILPELLSKNVTFIKLLMRL